MRVPVKTLDGEVLMPTSPRRAHILIRKGEATPYIFKGIFCIRLNREPSERNVQVVSMGIDPGSKKEGYSVLDEKHTLLNLQLDAVTHVKDVLESRRNARRARRQRNTPCRKPRFKNRSRKGWLPPSTRARWGLKLNTIKSLSKIYPISVVVVEDVAASTKQGKRGWNVNFSPIEVGKKWFYSEIKSLNLKLITKKGWETMELRSKHSLTK